MANKQTVKQTMCCRCGGMFVDAQFYRSYSEHHAALGGHLPICKECFHQEYDAYIERYQSRRRAMKRMCMIYDVYYSDKIFDSCENEEASEGRYFRKLNIRQCKDRTFEDSLQEGFMFVDGERSDVLKLKTKAEIAAEDPEIEEDDIEKWGSGFLKEDYEMLNAHYKYLKAANPNCDSNQEIFIKDLCYINMQKMKAVRGERVEDYNKLTESYRKSFSQAGLKTVRDASEVESFSMGATIEMIEKYTPAEYYKNKDLYKDHDNIGEYIERLMLRPLRNLMHGTTERDHEYYIRDEEDTDGYDE